jgi:hypothetical protein
MTDDTAPPPSNIRTPNNNSIDHEGRPGFIADLGFTLIVPWLVLWGFELPDGPSRSLWAGWWPVVVVVGLLGVALAIGITRRKPRGFLPYNVRWFLLAATLVLPAWIALSLADNQTGPTTFRAAADRVRAATGSTTLPASEERAVRDAVASSEKLGQVLEQAESQGTQIPQKPIPGAEALEPETRKIFEQAHAFADAIEHDQPLPQELTGTTAADDMDKAKVMAALLVLAAAFIAPLLGLSPELVLVLLQGLVAAGSLTLGSVVRLGATLASATNPDGSFDEAKVRENFERYEELGRSVDILVAAAEKNGADVEHSPLGQLRRAAAGSTAPDLAKRRDECRARVAADLQNPDLESMMKTRCQDLNSKQRESLAAELKSGAPR